MLLPRSGGCRGRWRPAPRRTARAPTRRGRSAPCTAACNLATAAPANTASTLGLDMVAE